MLPPDIINFLRWAQDCGFAPLDLMAADLLKKYTAQVGPSEHKETVTYGGILGYAADDGSPIMDDEWPADG